MNLLLVKNIKNISPVIYLNCKKVSRFLVLTWIGVRDNQLVNVFIKDKFFYKKYTGI